MARVSRRRFRRAELLSGASPGTQSIVAILLVASMLSACARGPTVTVMSEYRSQALHGKRVLFTRLAVSDDFEDARTGVMLSGATRLLATRDACSLVTMAWSEGHVVCVPPGASAHAPSLLELERLFALDTPIRMRLWEAIRKEFNVDHVLLFRPEGVSSAQSISQKRLNPGQALQPSTLDVGPAMEPVQTSNQTELSYTVSARLIDTRTGELLKLGVHSGEASRSVKHNLGYAEAPDAEPILSKVMADLAEKLLQD